MTVRMPAKVAYDAIYQQVRKIPRGRVATYGQIAALVGRCTARMVGYAMAAVPEGSTVPWHRVINSLGAISPRAHGDGAARQKTLLRSEGVRFDARGRVELEIFRWRDGESGELRALRLPPQSKRTVTRS
jgi:methylated-DNA-protein-cysteine methyltransferase related protein